MAKNCGLKKWAGREVAVFYQRRSEDLHLNNSDSLDEFSVKSLGNVFEKIYYVEHNTTPALKYTLTATAKELFFKFSKPNEDDSQGAVATSSISSGSKKYKNTPRVALNMHVLYHWLTKAFALHLESGTTPTAITAETMQMEIIFMDTVETMKGFSELVSSV